MKINILLFNKFETLDAFGPAEIFGKVQEFELDYFSVEGGIITSSQNVSVVTKTLTESREDCVWLIPGGEGTRNLVHDEDFLFKLKQLAQKSKFCLSVCTGSALLAKSGVEIRLIHAKEPGPAFRRDFDKYPALIEGMERALCPRVHFKIIIFDLKTAYVGSANLTGAGLGMKGENTRNFEAGVLSSNKDFVKNAAEQFDSVWM